MLNLAVRASGEARRVRPCSQGWDTVLASKGAGWLRHRPAAANAAAPSWPQELMGHQFPAPSWPQELMGRQFPAPSWPQELMGRQFWFLISTRFQAWFLGRSKYNEHTREEEDRDSVKSFNGNWLSRSLPESWKPRWTANACDLSLTVWRAVHIALPQERVSDD